MTNDQSIQYFDARLESLLKDLDQSSLRDGVRKAYAAIGERARQIPLAALRSRNFHVEGNKADWESGLRVHVYSGGGGFLVTARGRRGATGTGAGEAGMHENRYYGKMKRRLPILQWQEYGTKERKTRGTRKRQKVHSTGSLRPSHFLTSSEAQMVQIVERDTLKEVYKVLDEVTRRNN